MPPDANSLDLRRTRLPSRLPIRSKHARVAPGFFNPLALDARGRASERYRLSQILEKLSRCRALNPRHHAIRKFEIRAQLSFNQALSQALNQHWNLTSPVATSTLALTPIATLPNNPLLSLGSLDIYGSLASLPRVVKDSLATFLVPHPWLAQEMWRFQPFYPRASGLVSLYVLTSDDHGHYAKKLVASDRSAGRLYHLAEYITRELPYLLAIGQSRTLCVQYLLSNTALT